MNKLLFFSFLVAIVLPACNPAKSTAKYMANDGAIYGTYYHVSYESPEGYDLHPKIDSVLHEMDLSLSTFKTESILSKVNTNQNVVLDNWFVNVFNEAQKVSELTAGAFDVTVAPLVNVWGFGFRKKELITPELIDSIEDFVGYQKVKLVNGKIRKDDQRTMLDFSAIAKGYTVDVIGDLLASEGCKNFMVEIGGEVVAHGVNKEGKIWRIGINEPNDNEPASPIELQAIISLKNKAVATSGNYRNFYVENGKKYAHTIDPHTGYPVDHSLLSATVIANDCMTADAFATALMVLGVENAMELVQSLPDIEVYLIYADDEGVNQVKMSKGFSPFILTN
ncbi:MAG: FAD:protein FMN transferase [Prolixibacteraceae bacterium]